MGDKLNFTELNRLFEELDIEGFLRENWIREATSGIPGLLQDTVREFKQMFALFRADPKYYLDVMLDLNEMGLDGLVMLLEEIKKQEPGYEVPVNAAKIIKKQRYQIWQRK